MFKLPEDGATINIVQKSVKLIRLIKKTPVINEDVLDASTALVLISYADW
jgi:hypothetical protein